MLLLNKALVHPNAIGNMEDMTAFQDRQAFPVDIVNEQEFISVDEKQICSICSKIISDAGFRTGRLGVVLTDNRAIHELNLKYLGHDYATDVISFTLEIDDSHLEAELVVSTEVAKDRCTEFEWSELSELMLYVVHGTLHQVGYDDKMEEDALRMRRMEAVYLALIGIDIPKNL